MVNLNLNIVGTDTNTESYSSEYQTVLSRATTLGYTKPSASQRVKQNTLVEALKTAGIWDLLDVFYVFATNGGADFATLNWKSPSNFQISRVNSPSFTSNVGFNSDGATSYLSTNWVATVNAVNFTLNSAGLGGYVSSAGISATSVDWGVQRIDSASQTYLQAETAANTYNSRLNANGNSNGTGQVNAQGFWHQRRVGSTATNSVFNYKNGVALATTSVASVSLPNQNMFILAQCTPTGTAGNFCTRGNGCFWTGAPLTGKEVDFYTAWNNYYTSL
jgi:hypothetical protein